MGEREGKINPNSGNSATNKTPNHFDCCLSRVKHLLITDLTIVLPCVTHKLHLNSFFSATIK